MRPESRRPGGAGWARALPLAVCLVLLTAASARAQAGAAPQAPDSVQLLDRIVAIVGDTVVLLSEVNQEFFRLQSQGAEVPVAGTDEWTRLARQVVAVLADRLILLQRAKRQGITPEPERVDALSEDFFQQARQRFSSDQEMQRLVEASGMNMLQYRQLLRSQAEAEILLQAYRQTLQSSPDLPPVAVSEDEVVAYFEENWADERRPATVSFNQLIVMPLAAEAARDSAIGRALAARREVDAGEDFKIVARRHSDDETTREAGGELGWMRRSLLVRPFADAAWGPRAGAVVGPIETRFGFHLIKVDNVRAGERLLSHILIRPRIEDADVERAREFAVSIVDSLRAGADPERLARLRAVDGERVRFDNIPLSQLSRSDPALARQLESPEVGDIIGPFEIQRGGPTEFGVVEIIGYRPEGPYELDEVRDEIRRRIRLQKQLDVYLRDLRRETFIEVRL